jgi:ribosomal protein S18 acetylase RimI-like enzyme
MSEITFDEFAPAELAAWLGQTKSEYMAERMAAGESLVEARTNADASMERAFPSGSPRPDQMAGWVCYDGRRVGQLWIGPFGNDPEHWWVWNVEIDDTQRGRGLGRQAMILAEKLATAKGAKSIGLNVFAHNRVARSLYESLGYEEVSRQMRKPLPVQSETGG